ncbi:MAG: D-2-hydroxyacid dehydrogenase [Bilophila sp.]
MNIVVLDGATLNPGDNPWTPLEKLAKGGTFVVYERTAPEQILERSMDADILITNKTPLNAATLCALPRLRCIGVVATGYDVVDIGAARKRDLPVINVVNYGTESVAQHAFAMLLELCRHTALHDAAIRAGRWAQGPDWCFWDTPQVELSGKVMGILGYGTIGHRVAQLAQAFGMSVCVASARKSAATMRTECTALPATVTVVECDDLFRSADVVTLHCPLSDQTRGIVNAARISTMKDGAILLNLARGALLDEQAVAAALLSGKLGGLGADVLSVEPVRADNPLLTCPNTLLTPHIAWATLAARRNITRIMAENLAAWLAGEPRSVVN